MRSEPTYIKSTFIFVVSSPVALSECDFASSLCYHREGRSKKEVVSIKNALICADVVKKKELNLCRTSVVKDEPLPPLKTSVQIQNKKKIKQTFRLNSFIFLTSTCSTDSPRSLTSCYSLVKIAPAFSFKMS